MLKLGKSIPLHVKNISCLDITSKTKRSTLIEGLLDKISTTNRSKCVEIYQLF